MSVREVTLDVGDDSFRGRLNTPDGTRESGVLVVPGAGHGPFGDVFDRFAEAAADAGHCVARFGTWESRDDLDAKTDADFEAEIDAGVEFLRSRDCSTVTVTAKSFGGRLALQHAPDGIDRMVLWAPAVVFGEHEEHPSIDASALADVEGPVRILHGDEDEIPIENSAGIAEHLPDGELVALPDEDHSFQNDEERIVEETLAFLPG